MADRRRRPMRLLWVVAFALLVWLLLRLNQFLPGVWPGGGEDAGFKPTPRGAKDDPDRVRPPDAAHPLPKPESPTIHVVVRAPDGTPFERAALAVHRDADWLSEQIELAEGAKGGSFADKGGVRRLRVDRKGVAEVSHGRPPADAPREWVVTMPRAKVLGPWFPPGGGAPADAPPFPVSVVDSDGAPVAGATLDVFAGPGDLHLVAGADGKTTVPRTLDVIRVCASAPGHGSACAYGTTYSDGPLEIRLPREKRVATRFVDPKTGAPVSARSLRLVSADGTVKTLEREGGSFPDFETTIPADLAATTHLEIDVLGRPIARLPLSLLAAETPVPAGRVVALVVRDATGKPVAKATVEARYAESAEHEPATVEGVTVTLETDAEGRVEVPLPAGRSADVRVEAKGFAPAGFRSAETESDAREIALGRGTAVAIAVKDAAGKAVPDAEVIFVVKVGESSARRTGRTGADGVARIEGVPAGRAEAYAHAVGFAWALRAIDVGESEALTTMTLRPGRRLLLVVEDPRGVPLPGVTVRAVPRADAAGAAGAPDPLDPDGRPWVTDANGVLSIADLAEREVDLYLARPGYGDEIVPKVMPGATTWFATLVPKP